MVRLLAFCAALLSTLTLCGCGGSFAEVSGKVTYQNKPVKGGSITFISTSGPSVSGTINEDGSYNVAKVPSGDVKICVDTEMLNPAKKSKVPSYRPPAGQTAPEGTFVENDNAKRYVKIPPQYAQPDQTDLTLNVGSGKVEHNVELK